MSSLGSSLPFAVQVKGVEAQPIGKAERSGKSAGGAAQRSMKSTREYAAPPAEVRRDDAVQRGAVGAEVDREQVSAWQLRTCALAREGNEACPRRSGRDDLGRARTVEGPLEAEQRGVRICNGLIDDRLIEGEVASGGDVDQVLVNVEGELMNLFVLRRVGARH